MYSEFVLIFTLPRYLSLSGLKFDRMMRLRHVKVFIVHLWQNNLLDKAVLSASLYSPSSSSTSSSSLTVLSLTLIFYLMAGLSRLHSLFVQTLPLSLYHPLLRFFHLLYLNSRFHPQFRRRAGKPRRGVTRGRQIERARSVIPVIIIDK